MAPSGGLALGRLNAWPSATCGQWFVLRTKARQEKVLARELEARSLAYFLPLVVQVRYHGPRKAIVEQPLFGGYIFLRSSLADAYVADRTRRVAQIIRVADQDRIDRELRSLHLALDSGAALDPYPYLKCGVNVQVRGGPFQGVRGVIESRSRANLLILQIQMLGRAVALEIDGSLLDVVDELAPADIGLAAEDCADLRLNLTAVPQGAGGTRLVSAR